VQLDGRPLTAFIETGAQITTNLDGSRTRYGVTERPKKSLAARKALSIG